MTGYAGGSPTSTATGNGQLNLIATTVDVESSGIEILADTADYCELTLVFYINDSTGIPYSTVKETSYNFV